MKKLTYIKKALLFMFSLYGLLILLSALWYFQWIKMDNLKAGSKLLTGVCLVGVLCILYIGLVRYFIRPYREWRSLFQRFTEGQVYRELLERTPELMEELGAVFERFDELVDRNKTIQLSTKQAEFLALQNQINPHFLYNTLDAIRGDALCAGLDNIADITEALSTFFRYTITETGNLVTIMDEISNVEDYFTIQQYRFGRKLRLEIEAGEDTEQIMKLSCPKLMLQPVVENAIFHGLEKKKDGGCVRIDMTLTAERVIIHIRDDGVGMVEETLCKVNRDLEHVSVGYIQETKGKKGGIALNNVCRRIRLLFGEEYGIHVFSIRDYGTNVAITLPVILKRREETFEKGSLYH